MNQDLMLVEIESTQKLCQALMQTPHYKKMGAEGVFAIVEKAKSVGLNPLDALNGALYFVQGKVEMGSQTMCQIIREKKHSIQCDKLDDQVCILKGKRADNDDVWVSSFSIEDAKRAGIYRNQWLKYPQDMLYARALSRLARQLFPDVIKGCYVSGEISEAPPLNAPVDYIPAEFEAFTPVDNINDQQHETLRKLIESNETIRAKVLNFMVKTYKTEDLKVIPQNKYEAVLEWVRGKIEEEAIRYQNIRDGESEEAIDA